MSICERWLVNHETLDLSRFLKKRPEDIYDSFGTVTLSCISNGAFQADP